MKEYLTKFIDNNYKEFHKKLVFSKYEILGVRSNILKDYAKKLQKENTFDEFFNKFLKDEKFYEYLQIIAYGINYEKDFSKALKYTKLYLDFVDNWANCDTLVPKSFKNQDIKDFANELICENHIYKIRFGIICYMKFIAYKDGLKAIFSIKSDEYYINMARAWYFQVVLAKEFELGISFLSSHKLDAKTLKMTLQKCKDSYQISQENKAKLMQILV
ncbi:DNA alkylation repair protein [Campylobacter sp. RM12640]|uniref:DNA alkylation repair protein n=1 Tax=unclassified Campylobacter TaxID=2593542 RepID=UPI001EFAB31B|nr:DNA alkylation repair protein [Campylobacter sp. RM12651]MBZ7980982.1 DNA alkylation repair protein [Campylobacter sp. RM12640]MBZ7988301.1 DNA alkylation repair protein [Campylobacter sp. RM12635]ULO04224.1 AlkD-like DNA glycosylase [Campylobacter sp. RM12651]